MEKNCAHGSCSLQSAIEGDLFFFKEYSLIQILSPLINIARNIYLNLPISILSKE